MRPLTTIGRLLFAIPFGVFGIMHFMNGDQMGGLVPIPGGAFWIYFTGAAMVAAAVAIAANVMGFWASIGLAALLVVYVVFMHAPNLGDEQMGQMAMQSLLKDLALAGGALTWAGLFRSTARDRSTSGTAVTRRPAGVET